MSTSTHESWALSRTTFWDAAYSSVEMDLLRYFRTERVDHLHRPYNEAANQGVKKVIEETASQASTQTVFVGIGTGANEAGMVCAGGDLYHCIYEIELNIRRILWTYNGIYGHLDGRDATMSISREFANGPGFVCCHLRHFSLFLCYLHSHSVCSSPVPYPPL
jgi:hypothetical protein